MRKKLEIRGAMASKVPVIKKKNKEQSKNPKLTIDMLVTSPFDNLIYAC